MLVVRHADMRITGVYASPPASAADWQELIRELKRLKDKGGKIVVCGDLNASHPAWCTTGKTTGGRALQELLVPLKLGAPIEPGSETPGTRLPRSRGKISVLGYLSSGRREVSRTRSRQTMTRCRGQQLT